MLSQLCMPRCTAWCDWTAGDLKATWQGPKAILAKQHLLTLLKTHAMACRIHLGFCRTHACERESGLKAGLQDGVLTC